jgi:hypothetical protein
MPRLKRLYRAIARYPEGHEVVRHFQTPEARDRWAHKRLQGYDADPEFFNERPAIPPALSVDIANSDPVVFDADQEDQA